MDKDQKTLDYLALDSLALDSLRLLQACELMSG